MMQLEAGAPDSFNESEREEHDEGDQETDQKTRCLSSPEPHTPEKHQEIDRKLIVILWIFWNFRKT